ncbi:MAG: phosphoenolpyruvate--protein phosphotransferase [Opitutales bacterium]|nr:phosphoenolpyruvate--protein phosphotransferase [Opitutales bacterium]
MISPDSIMNTKRQKLIKGIGVSSGIVRGSAFVVGDEVSLIVPRYEIEETEIVAELEKFERALVVAEETLGTICEEVRTKIGPREAEIFEAQIMLVRDPGFVTEVSGKIKSEKRNVEAVVADVVGRFAQMFRDVNDPLIQERANDVRDVGRRVLACLQSQSFEPLVFPDKIILVTPDLTPSTTARLDLSGVLAVVTELGGKASHAAILMRSLGIPAVVAKKATHRIQSGDLLILDGMSGKIFVHPSATVIAKYAQFEKDFHLDKKLLKTYLDCPAQTQDGVTIELLANIGKPSDAKAAVHFKADGIGLFRTEFGFFVCDQFPTVEEHCEIYAHLAVTMQPRDVIIRVFDIGSDKVPEYFQLAKEANPSLGLRGTRLLLRNPEVLRTQLSAILRVSADHHVSVLFPGIAGVEEIVGVKAILEEERNNLNLAGIAFNPDIKIGAMIELPSAAIMVEQILHEVDFLSLGTNDLTQYILGADRSSAEMVDHYRSIHPAVLKAIKQVIDCARAEGKPITVCGAMAGNPARVGLLVGLGARSLSVAPGVLLEIKRALRKVTIADAEKLANAVLKARTVQEIEALLDSAIK